MNAFGSTTRSIRHNVKYVSKSSRFTLLRFFLYLKNCNRLAKYRAMINDGGDRGH
jgi:hypothetical protein